MELRITAQKLGVVMLDIKRQPDRIFKRELMSKDMARWEHLQKLIGLYGINPRLKKP